MIPDTPEPIKPKSWKEFFQENASTYDENGFAQNSLVEVQFLIDLMQLKPGMKLLDMGCGTGRHAVLFAEKGIQVTGVDFSSEMLEVARKKAELQGLDIEWVEADATTFGRVAAFDAAICICEGGLGLLDHHEDGVSHDLAILGSIAGSLKQGAPFVSTALNGYRTIRMMQDENVNQGSFDPVNMVCFYADQMHTASGPIDMQIKERLFIPPEMVALMTHSGFAVEHVWGGTAGEWGKRPLRLDEIEVMYVAKRK